MFLSQVSYATSRLSIRDGSAEKVWIAVVSGTMAIIQRLLGTDCSRAGRILAVVGGGPSFGFWLWIPHVGMDNNDS